jgi:hypothetical protein
MGGPGSGRKKGSGGKVKYTKKRLLSKKQADEIRTLAGSTAPKSVYNARLNSMIKGNRKRGGFPGSAIKGKKA